MLYEGLGVYCVLLLGKKTGYLLSEYFIALFHTLA